MTRVLSLSTAVCLLGAALLSTPASATDFSESADFGGTYGYIGPGVASLPDLDVDTGPLGAGVYVEPGVAFMSPAMDYASPASTWAPVYPQAQLEVVPAEAREHRVWPRGDGCRTRAIARLSPACSCFPSVGSPHCGFRRNDGSEKARYAP